MTVSFSHLLLALAAYRVWRLLAMDTILDKPRERVEHLVGEWLLCPWCCGFWSSAAWYAAWKWDAHWTLIAASPFAISAVVGLIAKLDD